MSLKLFQDCTDQELKVIYEQITWGKKYGFRPQIVDSYIEKARETYPLSFADGWSYTEKAFWEEVGKRFFESVPDEGPIPRRRTIYEGLKKAKSSEEMAKILSDIWPCYDCSQEEQEKKCVMCIENQLTLI